MSEQKKSSKPKFIVIIFILAIAFIIYKYWGKIKPHVNTLLLQIGINTGEPPAEGLTDNGGSIYDEHDPREAITGLTKDGEEFTLRGFILPSDIEKNKFPIFVAVRPSMTLGDILFAGQMVKLTYLDQNHLNYCGHVSGQLGNYSIPYTEVVSNTLQM